MASITNKSIRIEDLPRSYEVFDDDIFIINAFNDDTTYNIAWYDLRASFKDFPNGVKLPCGTSADDPALKFGESNSGIYSPCPGGDIHITTGGVDRLIILENGLTRVPGSVELGTDCHTELVVNSTSTFGCKVNFTDDITISAELVVDGIIVNGDAQLGTDCTDVTTIQTIVAKCDATFEESVSIDKNLTVGGSTTLGDDCTEDTLTVKANATFECEATFKEDVLFEKDITVKEDAHIEGDTDIGGDLEVTGNITSTDGKFFGDGSGLTNLNIPSSLRFRGDTDITQTAPVSLINGDFYLNIVAGNADASWTGLNQVPVDINQFVYYVEDSFGVGEWSLGSVHNGEGVVTLAGDQTIYGDKTFHGTTTTTFSGDLIATNIVNINPTNDRPVTGFATYTIEDTDDGKTIVNKEYVDGRFGNLTDELNVLTNTLYEDDDTDTGTPATNNTLTENEYLWYDPNDTLLIDRPSTGVELVGKWKRVEINTDKIPVENALNPAPPVPLHPLPVTPTTSPTSQTEANEWYYDSIVHLHTDIVNLENRAALVEGLQTVTEILNTTDRGIIVVDDKDSPTPKITLKNDGTSVFTGLSTHKDRINVFGEISLSSDGNITESYGNYYFNVFGKGNVKMGESLTLRNEGTTGDLALITSEVDGEVRFGHKLTGGVEVVSTRMHKTPDTMADQLDQVPVMPTSADKDTVLEVMSTVRSPIVQARTFDIELLPELP